MSSLDLDVDQVKLRVIKPDDAPDLLRLYSDVRITEFLPLHISTIKNAEDVISGYIKCWEERGFGIWSIRERESDRMIGRCGFLHWNDSNKIVPQYELAYLIEPDAWGQGIATKCARVCLKFGFEIGGFEKIFAKTNEKNIGSWRVMEKIGMKKVSVEKFNLLKKVCYIISKEQYDEGTSRKYEIDTDTN